MNYAFGDVVHIFNRQFNPSDSLGQIFTPGILIIVQHICDGCLPLPRLKQAPCPSTCLYDGVQCVGRSHQGVVNKDSERPRFKVIQCWTWSDHCVQSSVLD